MFHYGNNDAFIPEPKIAEVERAVSDRPGVVFHRYEAGHAFSNWDAPSMYHQESAEEAWSRTLDFFDLRPVSNGTQLMLHCKQRGCSNKYQPPGKRGGTGTMATHMKDKHPKVWQQHLAQKNELVDMTTPAAAAAAAAAAPMDAGPISIELDDGDSVVAAPAAAAAASPVASAASKRSSSNVSSVTAPPASKRPLLQQSLFSALASSNNAALADATALFFASNHIAHNVADSLSFHAFITAVRSSNAPVPRRRTLKLSISDLADRLREKVVQHIRGGTAPVTVAIDGWTNVCHTKVNNVVLLYCGVAFYWCSIPNRYDANTAAWLSDQLTPHLQELVRLGIRFTALVADNESVNDALFNMLTQTFPFLIRVPCAAHTIQLVVKQVIELDTFDKTLDAVRTLISHFEQKKSERQRLRELQRAAGQHEYSLVKANDTRWNSQLYACIRILKLRPFLTLILPQTEAFWADLQLLIEFLSPFQGATDVLQRDSATLHDVWMQMHVLHQHIAKGKARLGNKFTKRATAALQLRWDKQVNEPATTACALLGLTADLSLVDDGRRVDAAKKFIVDFGCSYLSFYQMAGELEGDVLRGALLAQLGAFADRRDGFAFVEQEVRALTAAAKAHDPAASINPLDVWAQHSGVLSLVAKALLSITASEAAVERSFSAQDAVHTKKRNRLLDSSVQQEMFVKFNSRALDRAQHQQQRPSATIELDPDIESFLQSKDSDSDSESVATEASDNVGAAGASSSQEGEESVVASGAAAAAAPAAPAAPARSLSTLNSQTEAFLEHYIAEHGITRDAISARRYWNGDRINALQCAATLNLGLGSATVTDLIKHIAHLLK